MNTYPTEYLLHPVPVLAVYGIGATTSEQPSTTTTTTSRPDNDASTATSPAPPSSGSNARQPPSSRAALGTMLQNAFSNTQQHSLYETIRSSTTTGVPSTPAFKTIFVVKVYKYIYIYIYACVYVIFMWS